MQGSLDKLGRLVIPAQFRHQIGIELAREASDDGIVNNQVDIQCDGSQVTIKPLHAACVFCGQSAEFELRGKGVCERCAGDLGEG